MADTAARNGRLGFVLLLACSWGVAPLLAQTTDNLSINRTDGNIQLGPQGVGYGLPEGLVPPGPEAHNCPDDLSAPYANCIGAKPLRDGSFYEGGFQDDRPDGIGRQREPDGTTYVGEFRAGRRHGYGAIYDREGNELYKGQWTDGLPNDPEEAYRRETKLKNMIKALQAELNQNGCGAGAVDGIIGPKTRSAATAAADAKPELLLSGDPFANVQMLYRLLQSLKSDSSQTCSG